MWRLIGAIFCGSWGKKASTIEDWIMWREYSIGQQEGLSDEKYMMATDRRFRISYPHNYNYCDGWCNESLLCVTNGIGKKSLGKYQPGGSFIEAPVFARIGRDWSVDRRWWENLRTDCWGGMNLGAVEDAWMGSEDKVSRRGLAVEKHQRWEPLASHRMDKTFHASEKTTFFQYVSKIELQYIGYCTQKYHILPQHFKLISTFWITSRNMSWS